MNAYFISSFDNPTCIKMKFHIFTFLFLLILVSLMHLSSSCQKIIINF